MTKNRIKSY